jgi:release factor glutamine methyltransferase
MNQDNNRRIDAVLDAAAARLATVSETARLDAEILLCQTIDMPRSYLFAHPEDVLDDRTFERFETLLRRLMNCS